MSVSSIFLLAFFKITEVLASMKDNQGWRSSYWLRARGWEYQESLMENGFLKVWMSPSKEVHFLFSPFEQFPFVVFLFSSFRLNITEFFCSSEFFLDG